MGAIVIDDTNVYWIESNGSPGFMVVRSMSKCGGASNILATVGEYGGPYALVLHKGYLWWIGPTQMQRMQTPGGSVESFGKPPQSFFRAFDVDDEHVFFDLPSGSADTLVSYSIANDTIVTLAASIGDQVRIDCANAYFTVRGSYTTELARVPKQGGTVEVFPSTPPSTNVFVLPGAIAMDDDALYWVTQNSELQRVKKDGTSTTAIADHAGTIALDDTMIYYVDGAQLQIMQTPKLGGAASVIASFPGGLNSLAADQRSIYWSEDNSIHGGGIRITKIDK